MPKYAIELAYDGTDYCGWQQQLGVGKHANPKASIEEHLVQALRDYSGEEVSSVVSSGRTDAGVHASGQVVHFSLKNPPRENSQLLQGINHRLPSNIQVTKAGLVPDRFRANSSCRKQYSYYFLQGATHLAHLKNQTMRNRYPLDGEPMKEALCDLEGEHDFKSFGSANTTVVSTVRTIHKAELSRFDIPLPGFYDSEEYFMWRVTLVGSGFLKHMVRSIAGTLKQIGENRRPAEDMLRLLSTDARDDVGSTAPASGLWLDRVWYPRQEGIDFLHQWSDLG